MALSSRACWSRLVTIGSPWWIHLGAQEKDTRFDTSDRQHNWKQGVIVEMGSDVIEIELPKDGLDVKNLRTQRVKITSLSASWSDLLNQARLNLRCVDWSSVSVDLFLSGSAASGYQLSRPVRKNEVIDFFLSHSWHDDGLLKYEAIKAICDRFTAQRGRPPSLWIDKCCIDQERISDGLRVLPVNLAACNQVLVACGPTYQRRLWCIWELFTLMAFTDLSVAIEKVVLAPLATDAAFEELAMFQLDDASCYDPNEEAQLLRVIEGLGKNVFTERVRTLGRTVKCSKSLKTPSWTLSAHISEITIGRTRDLVKTSSGTPDCTSTASLHEAPCTKDTEDVEECFWTSI